MNIPLFFFLIKFLVYQGDSIALSSLILVGCAYNDGLSLQWCSILCVLLMFHRVTKDFRGCRKQEVGWLKNGPCDYLRVVGGLLDSYELTPNVKHGKDSNCLFLVQSYFLKNGILIPVLPLQDIVVGVKCQLLTCNSEEETKNTRLTYWCQSHMFPN